MVRDSARTGRDVTLPAAAAPLIITAELPPDLHRWATELRRAHFPPERNWLDAHVTLFHALPPSLEGEVRTRLARMAREYPQPEGEIAGLRSLGRGTAISIRSPELLALREQLAEEFTGMLTAQDQHRPALHITIQNKVSPAQAKAVQAMLQPEIEARRFVFAGLALHAYEGGPWRSLQRWSFRS